MCCASQLPPLVDAEEQINTTGFYHQCTRAAEVWVGPKELTCVFLQKTLKQDDTLKSVVRNQCSQLSTSGLPGKLQLIWSVELVKLDCIHAGQDGFQHSTWMQPARTFRHAGLAA